MRRLFWLGVGAVAGASGTIAFVERAPGDDRGTLRFDGLRPEVESAPAGPLPTPLETWTRPIAESTSLRR